MPGRAHGAESLLKKAPAALKNAGRTTPFLAFRCIVRVDAGRVGYVSMLSVRDFLHGRHGGPLRPLHAVTMRAQVAAIRASDALAHRDRVDDRRWVAAHATLAIKTFERPATLRRLIRSARRYFDGRIIVADDSRAPQRELGPGVQVIVLPFNSESRSGGTLPSPASTRRM